MNRAILRGGGDVNPASSAGKRVNQLLLLRNRSVYALQIIKDKTSIYHFSFRAKSRFLNFFPPALPPKQQAREKNQPTPLPPFFNALGRWLA